MTDPLRVWDGVLRRLEVDISAFALKAWLQPLTLEFDANAARLSCPTAFHRERVREHFLAAIQRGLDEELGRSVSVSLVVGAPPVATTAAEVTTPRASGNGARSRDRRELSTRTRPAQ